MIVELKKSIFINNLFNFRKELKEIKKKKTNDKKAIKTLNIEDSTLIGRANRKRPIYISNKSRHVFVCGTTGSGKTVVLSNFIKTAIENNYPALIVDGKGDVNENSILDIIHKLNKDNKKKVYIINLNDPRCSDKYNPFRNANYTVAKDMLINMTEWSEEHYKLNAERYLQRLLKLLSYANSELSFDLILKYLPVDTFQQMSAYLLKNNKITKEEHLSNIEIAKSSGKIAENAVARFSLLQESEIGQIFNDKGIDIYTALKEKAIILFILNPLIYPELSPLMGRLILIDSKKAVSKLFTDRLERIFFILDEINVYASTSLLDLINKSRSANVTNILATQSLSDLDFAVNEAFKEQIIENCNNYIVLRQNSSVNAENWAKILGTRSTLEVTHQLQQNGYNTTETGFGSAKRVREFLYHPDDIKTQKTGEGFFLSRDTGIHCKLKINKPF